MVPRAPTHEGNSPAVPRGRRQRGIRHCAIPLRVPAESDAIPFRPPAESGDDRSGPKLEVKAGPRVAPAFAHQVGADSFALRVVAFALAAGVKIEIPVRQLGLSLWPAEVCRT